jgi:hypothetical protein
MRRPFIGHTYRATYDAVGYSPLVGVGCNKSSCGHNIRQ